MTERYVVCPIDAHECKLDLCVGKSVKYCVGYMEIESNILSDVTLQKGDRERVYDKAMELGIKPKVLWGKILERIETI